MCATPMLSNIAGIPIQFFVKSRPETNREQVYGISDYTVNSSANLSVVTPHPGGHEGQVTVCIPIIYLLRKTENER